MSVESEAKYESFLSALNEKERDLKKSIEKLEEKVAVKKLKCKIQARQSVIAQLEKKRDELELELKELENDPMSDEEGTEQTDENKDDFYIYPQFKVKDWKPEKR